MEWLSTNSFRTSHYPYADEVYDLADRVMVIDESPGVGIQKQNLCNGADCPLQQHHIEVMREMHRRDKNHASVIAWSIANEPQSNQAGADDYFRPIFNETRAIDGTRPVTFVCDQYPNTDLP